jgi:hypothetical protein
MDPAGPDAAARQSDARPLVLASVRTDCPALNPLDRYAGQLRKQDAEDLKIAVPHDHKLMINTSPDTSLSRHQEMCARGTFSWPGQAHTCILASLIGERWALPRKPREGHRCGRTWTRSQISIREGFKHMTRCHDIRTAS